MDLQAGDVFAGYRIDAVAGHGGMGVVYRATELALDRVVALKTIAPALAADASFRERFVAESKAAAGIDHPNVLPVFAAGEEDGVLFIAMRFVEGSDLRDVGVVAPERAAAIVAQVAGALDAAHARGLVHRDVKPANVLLTPDDHAYLTDFGLMRRLGTSATRAGGWVGTLGYVAPEQIRDERIDGRADVYALGCVLHDLVTGESPFERSSDEATLWAHLHEPAPSLGPPFGDVVARALAKDPAERFATAGELGRAALAAAGLPSPPPLADTAVTPDHARADAQRVAVAAPDAAPPERHGRRRAPVLALLAVLLVAGAATAFALSDGGDDDPSRSAAPPPATQATTATKPDPPQIEAVDVGSRPTGLAVARESVYVTRPRSARLLKVDVGAFDRATPSHEIGRGASDVDAGFGSLWVTTEAEGQAARLVRIDLDSGERTDIPLPGTEPVAVGSGTRAVWVGLRGTSQVVRVDPETNAVSPTIQIPGGVQDLDAGAEAVWITGRDDDTLTKIGEVTGEGTTLRTGSQPSGIAFGAGAVWTANRGDDSVERIDRRDPANRATIGVPGQPRGVAFGGGRLWVASFTTSRLFKIDGESGRLLGAPIRTALNPTKLLVSGDAVYVISAAGGRLERVEFEPRR